MTAAQGTPRTDAVSGGDPYVPRAFAQKLEREVAALPAQVVELQQDKRRLAAMLPLFEEARDAITAIPLHAAKLHGLRLDLADRMDDVGMADKWKAIDAVHSSVTRASVPPSVSDGKT